MKTRREILAAALAAGTAWPLRHAFAQAEPPPPTRHRFPPPVQAPHAHRPFTTPLTAPPREGLFAELTPDAPFTLTARVSPAALLPGPSTLMWSLDHDGPHGLMRNPLLRVRRGARLRVRLKNELPEETTVHWHGLGVDERNDGSGLHPVRAGDTYAYDFAVDSPAATYWYHPHPHYRTGFQINNGMAGMLLVEDARDDALRESLGLRFGESEMPLLIQDKQMSLGNAINYEHGDDDWIGNRFFVNYVAEPVWHAPRRLVRLRLLNASNSRPYRLALRAGGKLLPFHLIGCDGGPLERPIEIRECWFAPAQRLDVLVDFSRLDAGTRVDVVSLAFDPMEQDGQVLPDPALEHPGAPLLGEPFTVMAIVVDGPGAKRAKLPKTLAMLPPVRDGKADRTFRLHIDGSRWLINGKNHHDDHGAPRFDVRRGTREIWELTNDTKSMPHPMHVHGFHFRVLAREKSPAQVRRTASGPRGLVPLDTGWLDTVLVWPGERVRIAIDFSQPFTGPQSYMFHCHNLEHEDRGLMLTFRVVDA